MTDKTIPHKTVWFEPCGFADNAPMGEPGFVADDWRIYSVVRLQNAITPTIGNHLTRGQIESLISDGYTINIK